MIATFKWGKLDRLEGIILRATMRPTQILFRKNVTDPDFPIVITCVGWSRAGPGAPTLRRPAARATQTKKWCDPFCLHKNAETSGGKSDF